MIRSSTCCPEPRIRSLPPEAVLTINSANSVTYGQTLTLTTEGGTFSVPGSVKWGNADNSDLPNDTCTRGQIVTMLYHANG